MAMDWLMQLLSGAARLLLHPIFYFSFMLAFIVGMTRVLRERKDFERRVYDPYQEIRFILPSSLAVGAVLSAVILGLGLMLPGDVIQLLAPLFILFSIGGFLLLSPAWTMAALYGVFWASEIFSFSFLTYEPFDVHRILAIIAFIAALLVMAEGVLIRKRGHQGTTPRIETGKRGLKTAVHMARRLWLVPVFLPVPGTQPLVPFAEWWPVFSIGADTFYLMLFPFLIGFSMKVRSTLPELAVKSTGTSVWQAGVAGVLLAAGAYWYWWLSVVAILFLAAARAAIAIRHVQYEKHRPPFFTTQPRGVMIVGVLPASPAKKMNLSIGEMVTKVNGDPVDSEPAFYKALQKNAAYCKLEVIGTNGQLRFAQGSLYENEHHELGLLLAPEEKEYMDDSVFFEE